MTIDFLSAALPWVVMVLTVAIAAVMLRRRASVRKGFRVIAILWYCCAIARWAAAGDFSAAAVPLCVANLFVCLYAAMRDSRSAVSK